MSTYQVTIHETALGSIRLSYGNPGPHVFITGPQECTHHLTPGEARDAAAALTAVAAETDPAEAGEPAQQVVQVHVHGSLPLRGELHVDGKEFGRWLQHYSRIHGRSFR